MKKVEEFIKEYNMIENGDKIIAGISGGADSVCLLFVLLHIQEQMDITITAVHVNHGIRGETALRDEQFTEALCKAHGIKCVVFRENVELIAKKRKQSVEEAGRDIRREAFESTCRAVGGTKIATAHHQNDNAETLLMNLARGTGLRGLGGILPAAGLMIRPLLCLNRREIEDFVENTGAGYCHDETNDEDIYTRNRLRHQVIPILEEQVNSQAVRHMNEAMEQIRQTISYMEQQTKEACTLCVECTAEGTFVIKQEAFMVLHEVLQGMVIKQCLGRAAGNMQNITMAHVEDIKSLFSKQCGRRLNLPYGVTVRREYLGVVLEKESIQANHVFSPQSLKVPGITVIPSLNLTICCRILEKGEGFSAKQVPQKTYTKWFDYDIISSTLVVRARQGGDSIVIDKAGRRQKIKSYFINEKIPSKMRDYIPLITDGEQIIWILGYRMSSACQVTEQTKRVLEIKVTEEELECQRRSEY